MPHYSQIDPPLRHYLTPLDQLITSAHFDYIRAEKAWLPFKSLHVSAKLSYPLELDGN